MTNQYDYENLTGLFSVSSGDNAGSGMITDDTIIPEGMEEVLSVSGGDNTSNIYIIALPPDADADVPAETFSAETFYTIWDKPLEEYSVSEGLLLILVALAVAAFIWSMVKGGFIWLDW